MNSNVTLRAMDLFGKLSIFKRSKVIHSHATYVRNGNMYQMNINEHAPKSKEDFWALHFFRTYSDCIVTTDKVLSAEADCYNLDTVKSLGFSK
jgi:hypothetical protein